MTELYDYVYSKNQDGLAYDEAVQLFIWIYCSTGVLPLELRSFPIGRDYLIETFKELSIRGIIRPRAGHDTTQHWNSILEDVLNARISLDDSFPNRVGLYI